MTEEPIDMKNKTSVGALVGAVIGLAAVLGLDVSAEESVAIVAGATALAAVVGRALSKPRV